MQTAKRLTKRIIESVLPPQKGEILLWDLELKGFGVRIFPTGRRTYFVQYRNEFSHTRRKKIGVHGLITADLAREEAKKLLGEVAKGMDPSKEKQNLKTKPTMAKLANDYLEFHAKINKRPKSYKEDERMLDKIILKQWESKKVEEVTMRDVQLLHHGLQGTPYIANRARALLNKMFGLALQWKWISSNPVEGVIKYQEHKRTRWLSDQEVQQLYVVLDIYHNQDVANAIRLLLLTGSRRNEVLGATWDQFDLEKGVWTKPAHSTKQKKMEHLPLSLAALNILQEMQETAQDTYLFPGKVSGRPLTDIKKAWATISKRAGLVDVHLHDLRHTHASHLVSSGLSLSIVGKLLGHTQASTTQRYAHLADAPLRHATELFGAKVTTLTKKEA
jgi:integrase